MSIIVTRPTTLRAQDANNSANTSSGSSMVMSDTDFIRKNIKDNMTEIQLAQLGRQKSTDPQITTIAQQMMTDHTQILNDLRRVARQKKMSGIASASRSVGMSNTGSGMSSPGTGMSSMSGTGTGTSGSGMSAATGTGTGTQGTGVSSAARSATGTAITGMKSANDGNRTLGTAMNSGAGTGTSGSAANSGTVAGTSGTGTTSGTGAGTSGVGVGSATETGTSGTGTTSDEGTSTSGTGMSAGSSSTAGAGTSGTGTSSSGNTGAQHDMQGMNGMQNMPGMTALQNASATEFNTLFVSQMLEMHNDKVAELQTALTRITDPILKAAVAKALPMVRMHRDMLAKLSSGNNSN